jgi:hypothetical protein
MIVGIFGDSFGEPLSKLSWTHILKNKYLFDVKNYALACTTAFWSYCKLQKHINEVDTVIFVLTEANRLYHPDNDYLSVCTLNTVRRQLNNNSISDSAREIYKAAEQYHLYLTDPYFNQFVQDQLIKEITLLSQQHNKRLIIIPAFRSGIPYQTIFQDPLYDITRKEIYTNFKDTIYRYEILDQRANHLSKENNKQLASLINKLINNNIEKITLDDFIFTKYDNPKLYWEI